MQFLKLFALVFRHRPVQAMRALGYRIIGKRARARNLLQMNAASAPYAYDVWIDLNESQPAIFDQAAATIAAWADPPTFSILIHCHPGLSATDLRAMIQAARSQCHMPLEIIVIPDVAAGPPAVQPDGLLRIAPTPARGATSALDTGLALARGQFVVPLVPNAILAPLALFHLAAAFLAEPGAAMGYGDHDCINPSGRRHDPWFKPQWNSELLLAQDYLSQCCAIRSETARRALPLPDGANDGALFALVLQVGSSAAKVLHVPQVLCHLREGACGPDALTRAAMVERSGRFPGVTATAGPFGTVRVLHPLPATPPRVSIIIPTRDKRELLEPCIDSILRMTTWPNYEILVVDNASSDPDTLAYLKELAKHPAIEIVPYPQAYNYSAINNFAATRARGEYLVLLNNDTEVITPDWLDAMMRQAVRPEVGAVGAKLLYGDDTIQHAGVVIGMGQAAGHAHRFQDNNQAGYFLQAHVQRFASAVTAACLAVNAEKFRAVGGLDEEFLQIAYNDVDLCLKLEQAGWHNVYEPAAVLYHHESKSRGNDFSAEHIARYTRELNVLQERWGTRDAIDPQHHPKLSRASETYTINL